MNKKQFEAQLKRRCNSELFLAKSEKLSRRVGCHPECWHIFDRSQLDGSVHWQHAIYDQSKGPREPQEIDIVRLQRGALSRVAPAPGEWSANELRKQEPEPLEQRIQRGVDARYHQTLDKLMHMQRMRRLGKVVHPSALVGRKKIFIP